MKARKKTYPNYGVCCALLLTMLTLSSIVSTVRTADHQTRFPILTWGTKALPWLITPWLSF